MTCVAAMCHMKMPCWIIQGIEYEFRGLGNVFVRTTLRTISTHYQYTLPVYTRPNPSDKYSVIRPKLNVLVQQATFSWSSSTSIGVVCEDHVSPVMRFTGTLRPTFKARQAGRQATVTRTNVVFISGTDNMNPNAHEKAAFSQISSNAVFHVCGCHLSLCGCHYVTHP